MIEWSICGVKIGRGEKKQTYITPNVPDYLMASTFICGSRPGKTIVITAGVHSGEYPGVAAVIKAANEIDPQEVRGRILLIHCVNSSGFWHNSFDLVPEDGTDLNKIYPGSPSGSVGERIADFFVREIFPQADFIIDLHSGGQTEKLTPCVFFPNAASERVREISMAAAKVTDIPYLIASNETKGKYTYAASRGISGLLLERGSCGECLENWIADYLKDIKLLLSHLGVITYPKQETVCTKKVYYKTKYLKSLHTGLWYPAVKENMHVREGDLLGRVEDLFGNVIEEYRAKAEGRVFYYTCTLAVNQGDRLVAYGLEENADK